MGWPGATKVFATTLGSQMRTVGAMNCVSQPSHGQGVYSEWRSWPLKGPKGCDWLVFVWCLTIVKHHKIDCHCCHYDFGLDSTIDRLNPVFKTQLFFLSRQMRFLVWAHLKWQWPTQMTRLFGEEALSLPTGRCTAFTALRHLFKLLTAAKRGHLASPWKLFGRDNM